LGNACYHSVHSFLSSRLLSKKLKIRICNIIILPVDFYRCENWSLILGEERELRVDSKAFLRWLITLGITANLMRAMIIIIIIK
jgi:hypothetical protein